MADVLCDWNSQDLRTLLGTQPRALNAAGDDCFCIDPYNPGTKTEYLAAVTCSWVAFAISVAILVFYAFHYFKSRTGWEEVYVCIIELVKVVLEIFAGVYAPAKILQTNGVRTVWLRYAEWLLTCPVILIHLSNLTGLHNDYNKRTMALLVSDIGTIVMGITSAFATGPAKVVFFCLGLCYGANTFFTAGKIYFEAHRDVPAGQCKQLVKVMAYVFFSSWLSFPILFLMGPEGLGHISPYSSIVGHTIVDLMSKNLWGLLGHHLRNQIADYIEEHGSLVSEELNAGNEAVPKMAQAYISPVFGSEPSVLAVVQTTSGGKGSPYNIGKNSAGSGLTRCSSPAASTQVKNTAMGAGGNSSSLGGMCSTAEATALVAGEPVQVILGVDGPDMLLYFQEQVSLLAVPVVVSAAADGEGILKLAATADVCDVVLLSPNHCTDNSSKGLISRLKALGHWVVVYGWTRALAPVIEGCDIDGFIAGPALGASIDTAQLLTVLLRSQAARQKAAAEGESMITSPPSPRRGAASRLSGSFSNMCVENPKATAEMPSELDQPRSPLSRQNSQIADGIYRTTPSTALGRLSPGPSGGQLSNSRHSLQLGSLAAGLGTAGATTALPRSSSSNTVFSNLTSTTASANPGAVNSSRAAGDQILAGLNSFLGSSSLTKASITHLPGAPARPKPGVDMTAAAGTADAEAELPQLMPDNTNSNNALVTLEKEAGTAAVGDGQAGPDTASGSGVRGLASLNNTELLQQLLGEIARLKKEVGEAGF